MKTSIAIILGLISVLYSTAQCFSQSSPIVYNMVSDAKPSTNPNGVWSYGWSTNATGTFQLLTNEMYSGNGVDLYQNGLVLPNAVYCQIDFSTNIFPINTVIIMPDTIYMDPQTNAGMVRFTAPASGYYAIQGFFRMQDTNTQPHNLMVLINSSKTNYFATSAAGTYLQNYNFNTNVLLQKGDTVDFVNACLNGQYSALTTGIAGTVTWLPSVVLQLSWNSVSNIAYQIQTNMSLSQNKWVNFGNPIIATNTNMSVPVTNNNQNLFYRVTY